MPGLNLFEPRYSHALPAVEKLDTDFVMPKNSIQIDSDNYDLTPTLVSCSGMTALNRNLANWGFPYKVNSESASITFKWDYIGTYKDEPVGATVTLSDFIFNYKCNSSTPENGQYNNNSPDYPPQGYLPSLVVCSQIDDRRWILKGIDSALFTLKLYYSDTNEFVNLDPTCTYMSISELDQDSGGYEGVVPGDNCSKVYIAKDAYIKTGTLKSTDGTYLNAYYSTVVASDLRNKGMAEYDIDRRTGITMLFGGNSIKVRIIDTVGNIWYQPWFSPLFIEQPNPPTKNYVITK